MEQGIIGTYQQKITLAAAQAEKFRKLSATSSLYRLVVFGLMIIAVITGAELDNFTIIILAFLILALCFATLVARQSKFDEQKKYFLNIVLVAENEVQSITGRKNIYDDGHGFSDDKHHYTSDLDIFGQASLFKLINRAATSRGNNILAAWFRSPAGKPDIMARQQAAKELSADIEWKHHFQAILLFTKGGNNDQLIALFKYLKTPLELAGKNWIWPYIKIAPYLLAGTIVAGIFYSPAYLVAIIIAIFNASLIVKNGSFIAKSGLIADKMGEVLANYARVFESLESRKFQSVICGDMTQRLKDQGTSKKIAELAGLINKYSYSLIMLVGFVLNVFFLWALKQSIAIENWKTENQHDLDDSFYTVGRFEALLSLAGLHINYPDWSFPLIDEREGYTLTAIQIAHPLINSSVRVANDYHLDNSRSIDIITGSNMAGKSTFLRTIGINTVLALAGAPVCASSMQLSVMQVISYMRIKDSLNESTSTFKAEIDRLKMLLTIVGGNEKVFLLIDEMLRGTNSLDKYRGSKAVIEQLIAKQGVGMVATHDLQIAELEKKYPNYIRNFYFDIQVKDGDMLFDYKIKHGECKTFNASLLLLQIGIYVDTI